ncbi:Multicopper oxidase [hydrothermal vent metagenome]|uniref:Multicopper oxidase n=1 Tax=hydrothermal vent metagenome TaxID=652676 RepID=A0A1W1CRJ4_9ZZZZ
MKYSNSLKNVALSLVVSGLLVGCGGSSSNSTSSNSLTDKDKILSDKVSQYLISTTLPMLHVLPTMSDEDGNENDAKATYTLTANKNVNVKIETPDGSWNTPMWRYNNNPLPLVIRTNRGNVMTLNFNNKLDSDSTIHWHGFKIPAIMDGGPDFPIKANSSKVYSFTMNQPASPLWFHPHPDMQTGKQVYMGLAGVYLLEDEISKKLEADKMLPSGDKDIVLLVQDRRFDKEENGVRKLLYKNKAMDSDGMKGSTILVNGSVMPKINVETTQYRFRLYNVSNAKTYDFAFNDGRKFKIVGTDGGLLNKPVDVDHIMLGAAERVELVVDFSQDAVGSKLLMVSRPYTADTMSMMGNDSNSSDMNMEDNGMGLTIMRFDVSKEVTDDISLYTNLPSNAEIATRLDPTTAVNKSNPRKFVMSMFNGNSGSNMDNMNENQGMNGNQDMNGNSNSTMNMTFAINGKIFDPNRVDEFIGAGTTEIWELKNISPMAHPFHAHAIQYQILDRNGVPAIGTDLGWKDTFLVQPGETVRIIGKFEAVNAGDYMYHCHILEHEDAGMMGYFRVGDSGNVKIK